MKNSSNLKSNRLLGEKSPYLLQHAYNPVDWYPWGEEAFRRAKQEDKPIFLSIGYSTCHWCHVMEKDSFEDQEVADLLNENFVSIKVDREERPDLDQKYMAACQALTGQGGWPLTVFLTPDRKPFYAGTFFPSRSRYGITGMIDILPRLSKYWQEDRERVIEAGNELSEALLRLSQSVKKSDSKDTATESPGIKLLDKAYRHFKETYDHQHGGFGSAPKFPAPHQLIFLLRYFKRTGSKPALEMTLKTLQAIYRGGIFDQLGYGLHRYSVDERWLVPHFEKMLYDQAITAIAALEAYQASGNEEFADLAKKIFSYVLTDLLSEEGAFYSAEDADSEGEEGVFYIWTLEELLTIVGPEQGELAAQYYGVTKEGNFEHGSSILHRVSDDQAFAQSRGITVEELHSNLEAIRLALLEARNRRERPFLDDKIITSWNAMIIAALARGFHVLKDKAYLEAAVRAADFIMNNMITAEGRLLRRYRDGEAAIDGFLDDYANMTWAFLELYRAGAEERFLDTAELLNRKLLELFLKSEAVLRYSAGGDDSEEPELEAEAHDGASPSAVSVTVMNLLQLGSLQQDDGLINKARDLIKAQLGRVDHYPAGYAYLLAAFNLTLSSNGDHLYCTSDGNCGWE